MEILNHTFSGYDLHESLDQSDGTFKPGWKDIFRMNQNELESEIRKVSRDSSLDPRRKAYLIQNLMTRSVHGCYQLELLSITMNLALSTYFIQCFCCLVAG